MKKFFLLIVAALFATHVNGQQAFAFRGYDFSAVCSSGQKLNYIITGSDEVKVCRQSREIAWNPEDRPKGNLVIPESVINNGKTYYVTGIDYWAFGGCDGLTSVIIPKTIVEIGETAFMNCNGLTSVTINCDNDVKLYEADLYFTKNNIRYMVKSKKEVEVSYLLNEKKYLGNITIPAKVTAGSTFSVTSIGYRAFDGCRDLKSITIPNSVTEINQKAFYMCSGLTSVTIPLSVKAIGEESFRGCHDCIIYCQSKTKPSGWHSKWNPSECVVKWGATYKFQ